MSNAGGDWNPHSHRYERLSADEMLDRIDDGYYDDDPPDERPDWYVRGRAARKRRASQGKRRPSPDSGRSGSR